MEAPPIPPTTMQQLMGTWTNTTLSARLHFYNDETVKLIFPKHQPPIKIISSYQALKNNQIGIALGGVWTGPMMVNISELPQGKLTASFPDEKPILFNRQP